MDTLGDTGNDREDKVEDSPTSARLPLLWRKFSGSKSR